MNFSLSHWLEQGIILSQENGKVLLGWGDFHWDSKAHPHLPSFYFPDFFLENPNPWLIPTHSCSITILDLLEQVQQLDTATTSIFWEPPDQTLFFKAFSSAQELFRTTPLEKIVLYGFSHSTQQLTTEHRRQILIQILLNALTFPLHVYGFWKGSQEGILGATPEVLFHHQATSKQLYTMALAGTQKNESSALFMMNDPKLLREHTIVVEDIRNRLALLGSVTVDPLQTLSFPLLSHLYTPLSVQLSTEHSFDTLVHTLHPTPALGGAPRSLALEWLKSYHTLLPRNRFGAPVGFVIPSSNEQACYVAIRNITWNHENSIIGAGCGIVAESHFDTEWTELLLKTKSIQRFLKLC